MPHSQEKERNLRFCADQRINLEAPQELLEKNLLLYLQTFQKCSQGNEQLRNITRLEALGKKLGWNIGEPQPLPDPFPVQHC